MSNLILASVVASIILTTRIIVKNYWYSDILENFPSAIFLSIASWLFFVPIIAIFGYIAIIISNNIAMCAIIKIWLVLWIIRCALVDKYSEGSPGVAAAILLGVAPLIYGYWVYVL